MDKIKNRYETAKDFVQERLRWISSSCADLAKHVRRYHLEKLPELKKKAHILRQAHYEMTVLKKGKGVSATTVGALWDALRIAEHAVEVCKLELATHEQGIRELRAERRVLCAGLKLMNPDAMRKAGLKAAKRALQARIKQHPVPLGKLQKEVKKHA